MSYATVYQIVKYTLISLLSLMIFCTTLAIILVCLASVDYNNNNLSDRSLGIIIVLTIITIVFLLGLIGVSKSHLPTVLLFSCMDLFLLVITYYGSYTTRGANMGAFVIFLITTVLSFAFSTFIWRQSLSMKRSATTERLHSHHQQHSHLQSHQPLQQQQQHNHHNHDSMYDLYNDYEFSAQSSSLAYEQDFNDFNPYHYWTVESNDRKLLVGDRYDV